jgi:hypothetical protein
VRRSGAAAVRRVGEERDALRLGEQRPDQRPGVEKVPLSKKRSDAAEGTKGTPFSQCVAGGAKLLGEQRALNEE